MKIPILSSPKKLWQKMLRVLLILIGVVATLALLAFGGVTLWYKQNLKPLAKEASDIVVVVEPGLSAIEIADLLEEEGVIRSSTAFNWYVNRQNQRDNLKAGTYRLSPSYSVPEITDIIVNGRVDVRLLTIPPGQRIDEIHDILVEAGFEENEVTAALAASYDHPLLIDKPTGASLEGYIFPESYQIDADTSVEDVLLTSFDTLYAQLDGQIMSGLEKQGLGIFEAVTLASIVQQEVSDEATQRQVAQVFLLRLNTGIQLGSDVTYRYGAVLLGVEPSTTLDSPYNTRIHTGLPPGPISNFNLSALEAVANPTNTDYLYFVAGDDGNTYFSHTLEEHESFKDQYCIQLCALP